MKKNEYWYFETSGFNFLLKSIDFDAFLNTRELQKLRKRTILISPITLWEIMLTNDNFNSDFLVFSAQNFFSENLLASPTEIVIRYLESAYPENKVNYSIFTELEIGKIWSKMTSDNSVKFEYDKQKLIDKSELIRKLSKKLPYVLNNSREIYGDEYLRSIADILNVYYSCSLKDGFLPRNKKYDGEILYKLVILFVLLLLLFKQDIDASISEDFWSKMDIDTNNPTEMLIFFFEKFPHIFIIGPFLEMAIMAYNQVKLGKTNRGLIFDCFHMIYAPYVDFIVTGDDGFAKLNQLESRYRGKLIHIKDLKIGISPYIKK